jgi:hypothetical protein
VLFPLPEFPYIEPPMNLQHYFKRSVAVRSSVSEGPWFFSVILTCSLIFCSCAGQIPPSGGPPDTIPPEILETYPLPRTLQFSDNVLRLTFSEYVDQRSLEEAFFVSPPLGKLMFDWSGTEVEVLFSDSLRLNTTYVITIGTDVKDTRNNNRMAQAFSFAFSTGSVIDSGQIAGTVFDEKNIGITIFAYLHEGRMMDTLNPSFTKPDYLTQTGKDGSFLLSYLRMGTYRLFAVRDEYKNLLYDQQTDEFAVLPFDIELSAKASFVSGIQFQLSREDTASPFLSSVRSLSARHVLLRFSEPLDTALLRSNNIQIIDTGTNQVLSISDISFTVPAADIYLVTALQESSHVYRLEFGELTDTAGNPLLNSPKSAVFSCSALEDTTKPSFTVSSTAPNLLMLEPNDTLKFVFTEPVVRATFDGGWSVLDSSKQTINGTIRWNNSMMMSFVPSSPLVRGMNYTVVVILDSLRDIFGNHHRDSTQTIRLRTISEASLGSIEGNVLDEITAGDENIVLLLKPLPSKDARTYQVKLNKPGAFVFPSVAEGKYVLKAFVDKDNNGVHSYGKPFPFQPSERFTFYPDTLKVRARWPLEGVTVRLK